MCYIYVYIFISLYHIFSPMYMIKQYSVFSHKKVKLIIKNNILELFPRKFFYLKI